MKNQNTLKPKKSLNSKTIMLLCTLGLFILFYGISCIMYADKGFTHLQTFLNILINNSGLICIAAGMTCVMLTGGIDISVGSLVAMDCMILAVGMQYKAIEPALLILEVLAIGVLFGAFQGFLVGYLNIQPFIVSMAGLFFARGMTCIICKDQVSISNPNWFVNLAKTKIYMPFNIGTYYNKRGIAQVPYVYVTVIVALIVVIAIFLLLKYTRFGRSMYAVGGNQTSAALMGLNVRKTRMLTYVLSSFLCSIGGICYCMNTMCGTTTQALGLEMDAISSAVIGGTLLTGGVGNVFGSFVGVLVNGTVSSFVKTNGKLVSAWSNVITAACLCVFIILQAILARINEKKNS